MQVPIAKPFLGEEEKAAALEALSSGQLSQGPRVAEFERAFAAYHGAKHGVATSNGTTALTTALMAHEIGPGDEVIVPSFSFFATASCVLSVGATPVFADIDATTFCLDAAAAEAAITSRTRAIMPVHLYGLPADMMRFDALCRAKNLVLLEDAAQAHGAKIDGRSVGTFGTASFSFYPTKNMTTTEGGMVLTNDDAIAERLRMIRHQGMSTQYLHEVVGYNFRMTDPSAAIGLVQLKRLPGWQVKRNANAAFYDGALKSVRVPTVPPGREHVYHQYTVRVPEGVDRDAVLKRLNERGVGARVYYPLPIHRQPVFARRPEYGAVVLPATERATREVLSLPVHPSLTEEERAFVAAEVNQAC
jgi:dTDP-4-amino-4,6-dideoxygalactose transaminase